MSFFKFTALAIAIDSCDVAIIAPRTVGLDTDSTVLMARGQTVLPALTPAEAAAEVDATVDGDPLMAGPYDTLELGDGCYFGGRQVQRIAPTADGLGCVVTFGNVPAVLTVPDVDVDTMTDELNATGQCGGGGTSPPFYVATGEYEPVIVSTNGTVSLPDNGGEPIPLKWTRVGSDPDGDPAAGDVVTVFGVLTVSTVEVGPVNVVGEIPPPFGIAFPAPVASFSSRFESAGPDGVATINATDLVLAVPDFEAVDSPKTVNVMWQFTVSPS